MLPEVEAVFLHRKPAEIMEALGATSAGRAFRDDVRTYVEKYGQRGDKWGVSYRSWIEEPAPVLKNLKGLCLATGSRFRRLSVPPVLGTDYGPPPDDPINRFLTKFFGGPPPTSDVPGVLKGHAGSPGKVRGIARVIRSLEEADRLKQGDVLVTVTTASPWTPLFATAGGIVTDTGGILSHCAVVAREYRIPAVVGTGRRRRCFRMVS